MPSKFIQQLFAMSSDAGNACAIGFSEDGKTLEIRTLEQLTELLPLYFNHNKISSFIRQLNNYGFKAAAPRVKSSLMGHSYIHPYFQKGQPAMLKLIFIRYAESSPDEDFSNFQIHEENVQLKERVRILEDQLQESKRVCRCQFPSPPPPIPCCSFSSPQPHHTTTTQLSKRRNSAEEIFNLLSFGEDPELDLF